MSDISKIRSLTQDKPVPATQTFTGDGSTLIFRLNEYPLVSSTLIINLDPSFTYDVDEDTGKISFDVAPEVGDFIVDYDRVLMSDTTLQDFLDIESDTELKWAAALALEAMAANQALIQKKIKMLDLETDGPALAKVLMALAESYRKQISNQPSIEVVEQVNDIFGYREKIRKDFERST